MQCSRVFNAVGNAFKRKKVYSCVAIVYQSLVLYVSTTVYCVLPVEIDTCVCVCVCACVYFVLFSYVHMVHMYVCVNKL